MMPSMRNAHPRAVAGPNRGFNAASRLALVAGLVAGTARAEVPPFEPPLTGFVVGLEVGVIVATLCEARTSTGYAVALGTGAVAGLGLGFWAGALRDEPGAGLTLRAGAIGLAIPTAVLLWGALAEPPSPHASEDASPLARPSRVGTPAEKTQ